MRAFVGTSGYAYKPWKGSFYPKDLADAEMLRYYATRLGAVEINNTFYKMPSQQAIDHWASQVPDDFCFVLKASRRITHMGRLKVESVKEPVEHLFARADTLGARLGPVLFQLPPYFKRDDERLDAFLKLLPQGRRAAFEFRNLSWFDDAVYAMLRAHDAALCFADGEVTGQPDPVSTAGWGYLRLRDKDYDDAALSAWAERVRAEAWSDVFVFFKHEDAGIGPRLAARFTEMLR